MTVSFDSSKLDMSAIDRGSIITAEVVELATGIKRTERDYNLALLMVKNYVEKVLWQRTNFSVKVVSHRDDLHVLRNEEMAPQLAAEIKQAVRKIHRCHFLGQNVDRTGLSIEEQAKLDRQVNIAETYVLALRNAKRELLPKPYQRTS